MGGLGLGGGEGEGLKLQKKIYLILRVAAQCPASRCNVCAASIPGVHLTLLLLLLLATLLHSAASAAHSDRGSSVRKISQSRQTVTSGRFKMEPVLLLSSFRRDREILAKLAPQVLRTFR